MGLESRLKVIMVEKKISQTKLAEMTGLSRSTITLLANEKNEQPLLETALIISEVIGVPVNEIWKIKR